MTPRLAIGYGKAVLQQWRAFGQQSRQQKRRAKRGTWGMQFTSYTGHPIDLLIQTPMFTKAGAQQFLEDTIRDMSAVMALGRIYPPVAEPEWLTEAVERAS